MCMHIKKGLKKGVSGTRVFYICFIFRSKKPIVENKLGA